MAPTAAGAGSVIGRDWVAVIVIWVDRAVVGHRTAGSRRGIVVAWRWFASGYWTVRASGGGPKMSVPQLRSMRNPKP